MDFEHDDTDDDEESQGPKKPNVGLGALKFRNPDNPQSAGPSADIEREEKARFIDSLSIENDFTPEEEQ